MNPFRQFDDRLLLSINDLARRTPWLHTPMLSYATYGVVLFGVLLLCALTAHRHLTSRRLAATGWAGLAPLLALGMNQPLGHLIREARPYVTHPGILRLADVTTDFSFPSDHAVMAGAVAAGLLLSSRRLGLAAAALAVLMAFARVYIGAHYPWDVLAGLALGAVVAVGGWWALHPALTAVTQRLRRLPGLHSVFAHHPESSRIDPAAHPEPSQP
ncbi:MAG: phosphatase PAP2 family protein [Knoellia sp.]